VVSERISTIPTSLEFIELQGMEMTINGIEVLALLLETGYLSLSVGGRKGYVRHNLRCNLHLSKTLD
jgi:hypothetical protein